MADLGELGPIDGDGSSVHTTALGRVSALVRSSTDMLLELDDETRLALSEVVGQLEEYVKRPWEKERRILLQVAGEFDAFLMAKKIKEERERPQPPTPSPPPPPKKIPGDPGHGSACSCTACNAWRILQHM